MINLGFRVDLDWTAADEEDQVALRLQSRLMVALPSSQDCVTVNLNVGEEDVRVEMKVIKRRESLRRMMLSKAGSGQQSDGVGVLIRLMRTDLAPGGAADATGLSYASALAKIIQDQGNRVVVGKDENAVRQLISMISSDNQHVVEQACSALSSLAGDVYSLCIVATLAFASDTVTQKMLTKDMLKSLKLLYAHRNPEVQRLALVVVGNLAFFLENRRILVTSESLRDLLLRLTVTPEPRVNKAAARALAILGM
ncbi:Phospholipase A I [Euphorbia peplus]|nr:Phospholipase A I [Euphorbia peplus]